eukprot:2504446-Pyramimonas_sp.AAC.1
MEEKEEENEEAEEEVQDTPFGFPYGGETRETKEEDACDEAPPLPKGRQQTRSGLSPPPSHIRSRLGPRRAASASVSATLMEERARKLQRVNAARYSIPHASQSALASMRALARKGELPAIST